jgi:hypothetical protein
MDNDNLLFIAIIRITLGVALVLLALVLMLVLLVGAESRLRTRSLRRYNLTQGFIIITYLIFAGMCIGKVYPDIRYVARSLDVTYPPR